MVLLRSRVPSVKFCYFVHYCQVGFGQSFGKQMLIPGVALYSLQFSVIDLGLETALRRW